MPRKMDQLPEDMNLDIGLSMMGLDREKALEHIVKLLTDMGHRISKDGSTSIPSKKEERATVCFLCALTVAEILCDMRNEKYPWEKKEN
tara:strand:+ start:315 stop:581 length:267 start_codon:yes stop_codon:yes gene_type:complete